MSSLPGSPLATRKQQHFIRAPVTPQQQPRHSKEYMQQQYNTLQPHQNSPTTPGSPYTPLSLRSFSTSSANNSIIATPPSASRGPIAGIAGNWRVKGQTVSMSSTTAPDFGEDEEENVEYIDQDDALLPPPSLRIRPRAQSYLPPSAPPILRASSNASSHARLREIHSPLTQRSSRPLLSNDNIRLTSTPPRNPILTRQLRLRGSVTDPPARLTNSFAPLSQNPDLFNISEVDQEDFDHSDQEDDINTNPDDESYYYEDSFDPSSLGDVPQFFAPGGQLPIPAIHPQYNPNFMSTFGTFFPQSQSFAPSMELQGIRTSTPPPPSYAPADFMETPAPATSCSVCGFSSTAEKFNLAILSPCTHPLCSSCLTSALNIVGEKDMECAVCKQAVDDFKLVSIPPALPSTQSMGCDMMKGETKRRQPFGSLSINTPGKKHWDELSEESLSDSPLAMRKHHSGKSFLQESFFTSPSTKSLNNQNAVGLSFDFNDQIERSVLKNPVGPAVVLRIDNVPWDITPPMIIAWLGQSRASIIRVHVLLDRKGKTLSHAFIEVNGEDCARRILRGEVELKEKSDQIQNVYRPPVITPKKRSGVLGKGRRARGVTVTRSGLNELMRALFPSWLGNFSHTSGKPSLAGLRTDTMRLALERPLIAEGEINSLLGLIRDGEGSPFLKVPTLPYYVLTSILARFPVDSESRVFWNASLRDMLFDVSIVALETLHTRIHAEGKMIYKEEGLIDMLFVAARGCEVFTKEQHEKMKAVVDGFVERDEDALKASTLATPADDDSRCQTPPALADPQAPQTPRRAEGEGDVGGSRNGPGSTPPSTFDSMLLNSLASSPVMKRGSAPEQPGDEVDQLAKEFGVGKDVVVKLMERLALGVKK